MTPARVIGCILGGAVGDAIGGPHEGNPAPVRVTTASAWRLSDDTQLTMATIEGLIGAPTPSAGRIADTFRQWFLKGRFTSLGSSTLKAMRDLAAGAHWALAGARGERAAGNGAAMRVAPLAFVLDPALPAERTLLRDICRITHHHDEAYAGALAMVLALRHVAGHPDGDFVSAVVAQMPDSMVRDRLRDVADLGAEASILDVAGQVGCSGHAAESVPLALHAARRAKQSGFEAVVLGAASAGGDTDTIASMAGQIAGAWLGIDAIPAELVERLPGHPALRRDASSFATWLARR